MASDNTKPFQKHHIAVCGGDALVGMLMHHLTRFLECTDNPTQFVDDFGIAREGIARTRNDWAEELGATPKQIRRVLEKAERDLQFMVRAQRGWGKYRVNRMHLAVTERYAKELAKCVKMGVAAYREHLRAEQNSKAKGQVGAKLVGPSGPSDAVFQGQDTWPAWGQALNSSSDAPSYSTQNCISADAEDATLRSTRSLPPGEEENHTPPPPCSNELRPVDEPDPGVTDQLSTHVMQPTIKTVTSSDLKDQMELSGLLLDWRKACKESGHAATETATDAHLKALSFYVAGHVNTVDSMLNYTAYWDEFVARLCDSNEGKALGLKAEDWPTPSLEFLRLLHAEAERKGATCAARRVIHLHQGRLEFDTAATDGEAISRQKSPGLASILVGQYAKVPRE